MKNLILIICLLSLNTLVFSQDSIKIRTEIDTFNKSNYEGQFDYVFARKEARKQLFKFGGMINSNNSFFELAYERKLTKDISVNFSLNNTIKGNLINRLLGSELNSLFYSDNELTHVLRFSVESRWYYTMKKDIKKGFISDNLNGNYIGLRTNIDVVRVDNYFTASHELTWGMQRRILNNQYFDFNIGAGFSYLLKGMKSNRFQEVFNYRFTYGFILDNNLLNKKKNINCDALRCFEEEKNLWKIGISNAFSANNESIASNFSIAQEHKTNNSRWSIETKLSLILDNIKNNAINEVPIPVQNSGRFIVPSYNSKNWNTQIAMHFEILTKLGNISGIRLPKGILVYKGEVENTDLKTESVGSNIQFMPRFYWDLNKRIAQGKSANNLSGKYIGLNVNYEYVKWTTKFNHQSNYDLRIQTFFIAPSIGYQKRLLNHLFFDVNASYGAIFRKYSDRNGHSLDFSGRGLSTNFTFGLSF
jgi:hypothetical protein